MKVKVVYAGTSFYTNLFTLSSSCSSPTMTSYADQSYLKATGTQTVYDAATKINAGNSQNPPCPLTYEIKEGGVAYTGTEMSLTGSVLSIPNKSLLFSKTITIAVTNAEGATVSSNAFKVEVIACSFGTITTSITANQMYTVYDPTGAGSSTATAASSLYSGGTCNDLTWSIRLQSDDSVYSGGILSLNSATQVVSASLVSPGTTNQVYIQITNPDAGTIRTNAFSVTVSCPTLNPTTALANYLFDIPASVQGTPAVIYSKS